MEKKIAYIGIDYHSETISFAVIIDGEKEFYDTVHMQNKDKIILKYLNKLAKEYELKACYEASCVMGDVRAEHAQRLFTSYAMGDAGTFVSLTDTFLSFSNLSQVIFSL